MGISIFTQEYSSPIAASRMFEALIIDSRSLLPKLLPQFIKDVNVIEGDGGAGSIEQVNFSEGLISNFSFFLLFFFQGKEFQMNILNYQDKLKQYFELEYCE